MIVPATAPHPAPDAADLAERVGALEQAIARDGLRPSSTRDVRAVLAACRELASAMAELAPRGAFHLLAVAATPPPSDEDAVLDLLDALQVALLEVREEEPVAETRELRDVVAWMLDELGVSQQQLAGAVGVPTRTLQRWLTLGAVPPDEERRLRLLLRALNEVRLVYRGAVALRWLTTPHPRAGNRAPVDLADEPAALLSLASSTRFA